MARERRGGRVEGDGRKYGVYREWRDLGSALQNTTYEAGEPDQL